MIRWVCFDVGETLLDETGFWGGWADHLGVARDAFRRELAGVIARGEHHRRVFDAFRPGFDPGAAAADRLAAGDDPGFRPEDLFPDVRPCFAALRAAGCRIGIAGNTSVLTEHTVMRCGLGQDFIASSSRWGVDKPARGFFARLAETCGAAPSEIAYVGDRIDNDAEPARRFGMTGVWLRRGLWAAVQRSWPEAACAAPAIGSLAELSAVLGLPPDEGR
jgi:FMN phosphatase YigB (HAD superfamily)